MRITIDSFFLWVLVKNFIFESDSDLSSDIRVNQILIPAFIESFSHKYFIIRK